MSFISAMRLFQTWPKGKLQAFNKILETRTCAPREVVYSQGEKPQVFFILKSGLLYAESNIEIDQYKKYPVGIHEWNVIKTTRKICYRVHDYQTGAMFGHEEILMGINRRV